MKAINRLQHKVLYAHLHFLSILFLYSGYIIINEYSSNSDLLFFGYLFIYLILSAVFIYKKLLEKLWTYILVRFGFSIGIVFFVPKISMVFQLVGILLVLLYFFEMFVRIPNDDFDYKILIGFLVVVLWIPGFMLTVPQSKFTIEVLCSLMAFSLFVSCAYKMYAILEQDVEFRLSTHQSMYRKSEAQNEELRLSQERFKLIHDQMAKQKYDLERANERLNRITGEIYIQNELLRYISTALDIRELIELVTDAIIGTTGVDTCSLVLFDERSEKYYYKMESNHEGNYLRQLIEDVEQGRLKEYFENHRVLLDNNVEKDAYEFIHTRPVGSLAIIPLIRDTIVYGLLIAEHSSKNMFTDANIQFFTGISTQITIAINNANLYAQMEELAVKDGLTCIYNRKYFIDHIEELIQEADQKNQPLSVALFDIDHFKSVNDKYGHLFGDEAIKLCASITDRLAREYDGLAVRYGGEEFVLVLPNKSSTEAEKIVRQLHKNIKESMLLYEGKEHVEEVYIDISIGVSSYPEIAKNSQKLLTRADNAMYYSKKHGRGRVTIDSSDLDKVI
ncbi:sensor domain-containing diguanylate cyclase [Vallitaleaceae bacterium 9-2]